jgi:outer membrane protein OmpA-like peptidoglycan-associated protein/tetratricopeptide (TPR) repeat protein
LAATFAFQKPSAMPRAARIPVLLIVLAIFCHSVKTSAQSPAEAKRNGERAFSLGHWQEAQTLLAQYQTAKPGDFEVLTKLGISLYQLRRGEEARRYLEYVAAKAPDSKDPERFYYLARTRHALGEWEKAILAYKSFLKVCGERHPLRANAIDNIRRCVTGMQAIQNEQVALVENLGDRVNSAGDEFAPMPSVNHTDRIYFAAARSGSVGGMRNDGGYEDTQRGQWCSDMYAAQLANSGWELQGGLGGLLNTSRFEVPLGFNANGQILYFFRGFTLYSGEILADTAARKDEYSIQAPAFKSPVMAEEGDCNPFFFNDFTIIFASRRAGGYGGLDLWWTVWADSTWAVPVNLGAEVNTAYDEDMPFLANDGTTLFFSSNRIESMGGLDNFKTVFDAKKRVWQNPVNLGTPINSPENDAYFHLASDGRSAFFASDRLEGMGQRDLYITYFKEAQPEQVSPQQTALFAQADPNAGVAQEIAEIVVPTLPYSSDKDVLSDDNLKVVEQMAGLARNYPQTSIFVTVFTDASGPPKFDLYNGIKRAEIVGKALAERGVPASKILLRSAGPNYPIAREVLDAMPNPAAPGLNRRIELQLTSVDALPLRFRIEQPFVSEFMASPGAKRLKTATAGLSYRVEAAITRQILTNDALAMFGDLMIETQPGTNAYRYTAGLFKQHGEAAQLRKELISQGFTEASVVAYLNGIRISKAEAVALLKKYPDLAGYVRG